MAASQSTGAEETVQPGLDIQADGNPQTTNLLQTHYLSLLERLINQKSSYQADPGREDWLLKAMSKAVYSAFRSCTEHGAEEEAKVLLRK